MGFPETGIGIYPGLGGTQRTTRRIGPNLTKYLVLTGKIVGGKTLVDIGLADYFVSSAEVDDKIRELVSSGEVITKFNRTQPVPTGPLAEAAAIFQDPNALENLLQGTATGDLAAKVAKTLSYKAPVACRFANRLIDEGLNLDLDQALATELANLETIFGTEDALEGLSKAGRGRPEFKGK
jgi:enoyl-CoA hydratase/3-hydroxyacyl-CoA dehydrogenase